MRALVLAGLFAAWGCSSPPVEPSPPLVSLALDSVSVDAAVRELSRVTALPLVIDPAAERYAECARISVSTPTPRPAPEVVALVAAALTSSGFALTARPEGLVLSHDSRTTPASCSLVPARGVRPTPDVDAARIRAISDTEWELLRRPGEPDVTTEDLTRSARVVPHMLDGEVAGLRLYGIRRASFLGQLGFQNGDTVLDVNGHAIGDPEAALETYALLRDAERYEVHLERRGARRTHILRVVDAFSGPAPEPTP